MSDQAKKQREAFLTAINSAVTEAVGAGLLDVTNAQKAFTEKLAALEKAQEDQAKAMRGHDLPDAEKETYNGDNYSFSKVFTGLLEGGLEGVRRNAPMEFSMHKEVYAQGTVPDSAGGFLVPTQVFEDQIIPLLRPKVIVQELGITQLPVTGVGVIEIPREITGPVVENVAENFGTSPVDMSFGSHRLEPHTAQSYIVASRRFFQLGVGADTFIRQRMAEELALKWNQWTLKGTGVAGDPIGVLNTAGVNVVDFAGVVAGGRVSADYYKKLLEMEDALADANALQGASSLGFAMANKAFRACRQIESDNNVAGTSNLSMNRKLFSPGAEERILGYKYTRTTELAQGVQTEMLFGDWSKAILATWNNLSIEASNVANDALQKRQTHIVAHIDVDVAVTQPTAFAVASNLDLSSI